MGKKAVYLNPSDQIITLNDGTKIHYAKLLLATGGNPNDLTIKIENLDDNESELLSKFRSTKDFKALKSKIENGSLKKIAILGGGFLGSELAFALAHYGNFL